MERIKAGAGLVLSALLASCGPIEATERGQELFADPKLSISNNNLFSCATCHSATAAEPDAGRRLPGYSLWGAASRPSYWGGEYTLLSDAVNFCLKTFMRGEPLTDKDPAGLALLAYLRSLAPQPESARSLTVVKNVDTNYLMTVAGGDAGRGAAFYQSICADCHGDLRTGDGRLGSSVSVLPDDTVRVFGSEARGIVVQKIRQGKFYGIGGVMPFYSKEVLSDAELADIATYVLK